MWAGMFQYRISKYDPQNRNTAGHYLPREWTMFSEVGQERGGVVLSLDEYERVESAYVESALAFLTEAEVRFLFACGVENANDVPTAPYEGACLDSATLAASMRSILRGEFWCRLEVPLAYVHFGCDYYMYVGVPAACKAASDFTRDRGLFVEPFDSPYRMDLC